MDLFSGGRPFRASKKEKGKILDEFTKVTGRHRKAAIRLFRHGSQSKTNKRRGRPRGYGTAVAGALRVAWEATDRLCSKRLHPFLPELVTILRRHGESAMTAEIEAAILALPAVDGGRGNPVLPSSVNHRHSRFNFFENPKYLRLRVPSCFHFCFLL